MMNPYKSLVCWETKLTKQAVPEPGQNKPWRGWSMGKPFRIWSRFLWWLFHIYLGKLSYFTNLNCWAIKGDHVPQSNYEIIVRENSEGVMKFTQIVMLVCCKLIYSIVGWSSSDSWVCLGVLLSIEVGSTPQLLQAPFDACFGHQGQNARALGLKFLFLYPLVN
jgi:hypothetical protein